MFNSKEKFYELVLKETENNRWDYKRDIHTKPDSSFAELLKDILALANSGGGWLVLGVDDKGNIVGVDDRIDPTSLGSKILSSIGIQVNFELNYYEIDNEMEVFSVGLLYIYDSERILVAPRDFHDKKSKIILQENTIYFRRNCSSTKANADDLSSLFYKISKRGEYDFKKIDLEILESNKKYYYDVKRVDDFLLGEFQFNALKFSDKLNYIYSAKQSRYTMFEMGILLGFEAEYIDDYFEGKRLPKLEHLLRAIEIFDLPHDYFLQATYHENMPFVNNPAITHVLLDKANSKMSLLNLGMGKVIKKVFYEISHEFECFTDWLFIQERPKKIEDEYVLDRFSKGYLYDAY